MIDICPLYPYPVLLLNYLRNGITCRYIVISDLHIGFESDLNAKGISIDSSLLIEEMLKELCYLIKSQSAEAVIILGDLKNTIASISKIEWETVPNFFEHLSEKADVYFIPGNHDSNIRFLTPWNINVVSSKGMIIDGTLLIHGHAMPSFRSSSIKRIIMGHIHPIFNKPDSLMKGERVWIYLNVRKEGLVPGGKGILDIIVLPSFNKYLYATNRVHKRSISPIITRVLSEQAVNRCLILTLDGSIVGNIAMLDYVI